MAHERQAPNPARLTSGLWQGRTSGFAVVAVLLVLWELSARLGWITSSNWPPFLDVLKACANGILNGELVQVILSTLYRMTSGYALGVIVGVLVGFAFATLPSAERLFGLSIELIRPIPIPAVIPPLILFLGVDNPMKVTVVAITVFFPVLINTVQGVQAVEPTLLAVARTFQVRRLARMRSVVLPAMLPFLLVGMRISLALALIAAVIAEMIAGNAGIGHYLVLMQYATRATDMYAAIILLAAVGYSLNYGLRTIERKLLFWHAPHAES